jgi:DNA invertase Pin-like site-specific DNA recombinase
MRIDYARVSTTEQDNQLQIAVLENVCEFIFQERTSGSRWDRPELHCLLTNCVRVQSWCGNWIDYCGR